jgi:hypothetical protein
MDVLAPKTTSLQPLEIRHLEMDYKRNDYVPKMTTDINTITLRLEMNTIETDQLERLGIFRYRLSGNQFERIQPLATNDRYFVDEWLQMPWPEAIRFSDPSALLKLKPAHDIFATRYKDMNNITSYEYGPVSACRDSKSHFEVEIDIDDPHIGNRATYYGIQQNGDGYTMLTAKSSKPDPRCGGPDLMKKK